MQRVLDGGTIAHHDRRRRHAQLDEVGRPAPTQRLDRLGHLQRVADGAPERLVHAREHAVVGSPAAAPSPIIASASSRGRGQVGHERAAPDLDVEHEPRRPRRDLLRHDARRRSAGCWAPSPSRRAGRRCAGRRAPGRPSGRRRRTPTRRTCSTSSSAREVDPEAGDRLQLVERPAGVAEAASRELRDRHAAGSDQRADHERRLVADAAGRVLVGDRTADRRHVQARAGGDHRLEQVGRLARRSSRAGRTAIRNAASWYSGVVRRDHPDELPGGELAAVALARDQVDDPPAHSTGVPGRPSASPGASTRSTVAPTSANVSPSWRAPISGAPGTCATSKACSRE